MRVAFTIIESKYWTGGYNYLLNLLTLLANHEQHRLTPVLLMGDRCNIDDIKNFENITNIEIIKTPLINKSRKTSSLIQSLVLGGDIALKKLLKSQNIDVVFESAQFFGWRLGIPVIAWIPDFQHKLLPHLFSRKAWWKREIGFRIQIATGRTIMLSSDDARNKCDQYYPTKNGQTRTIHFAVPANSQETNERARMIADSYNLPTNFFFMPNQFWRHKNHELVIDALNILQHRGKQVVIAASGKQEDLQSPDHFPSLLQKLKQYGLEDNFRLLGLIPYQHIKMLMQACMALLNPSLYEGWSTTVEEARSMGVPMLLSNLDVHHEQMGENADYFDRYSAQSLAEALDNFIPLEPGQRKKLADSAQLLNSQRTKQFAYDFVELATYCATKS